MNVNYLYPESNSQHESINSYKYNLNCKGKINDDDPNTQNWLEIQESFDHQSNDFKIFTGILEKQHNIVVKIGNYTKINSEYVLGNLLKNIPNFVDFYCHFTCYDNFNNVGKNKSICKKKNENLTEIGVIVMPFYKLGRIDKFNWKRDNFILLKSILKHIICSILYAYEKHGFIHKDTHLGNILLKNTRIKNISYGNNIQIDVQGILPVIMDYDRSIIDEQRISCKLVYTDIIRILLLTCSELDIKSTVNEKPVKLLESYIQNNQTINDNIYKELCEEIDNIQIKFIMSELKLPW